MNDVKSTKGFLVAVEVRYINEEIGKGVFSLEFIKKGTLLWLPNLVKKYSKEEVYLIINEMENNNNQEDEISIWLRQAFILSNDLDNLCVNISDDGRFVNHSSNPNTGYASESEPSIALRDISINEELTCDYSGLGSPLWYKSLCKKFNVLPTDEVAKLYA